MKLRSFIWKCQHDNYKGYDFHFLINLRHHISMLIIKFCELNFVMKSYPQFFFRHSYKDALWPSRCLHFPYLMWRTWLEHTSKFILPYIILNCIFYYHVVTIKTGYSQSTVKNYIFFCAAVCMSVFNAENIYHVANSK